MPFIDEDDWIGQVFDSDVRCRDLNDVAGGKRIFLSFLSDERQVIIGHIVCDIVVNECCWVVSGIYSEFGDGISDFVSV